MYSPETVYLDNIDGFGFEDLCAHIFERLNWGRVQLIGRVKDGGKDIVIHLPQGGSIIIECKHQMNTSIGRPIVQKLHSAVISNKATKGIIITTGRFSTDAINHANLLSKTTSIELYDLSRIKDLADRVNIQLLTSGSYSPIFTFPATDIQTISRKMSPIINAIQSYPKTSIQLFQFIPNSVKLESKYLVKYDVEDELKTSTGVKDEIYQSNVNILIDAQNGQMTDYETLLFLVDSTLRDSSQIPSLNCPTTRGSFSIDKTSLNKLVKDYVISSNRRNASWRGNNNVSYAKSWAPGERSITIRDIKKFFCPDILL